jgi:hypothetical protein
MYEYKFNVILRLLVTQYYRPYCHNSHINKSHAATSSVINSYFLSLYIRINLPQNGCW